MDRVGREMAANIVGGRAINAALGLFSNNALHKA
jgi:hypothetical protein